MVPSAIADRIHALNLDPFTETAICEIVQEAIDGAAGIPTMVVALQIPGDWPADYREQFWHLYPKKEDKKIALKALDKVAFAGKTKWADLIDGTARYLKSETVQNGFIKMPATFINAESWKNEYNCFGPKPHNGPSFFEIAAGRD